MDIEQRPLADGATPVQQATPDDVHPNELRGPIEERFNAEREQIQFRHRDAVMAADAERDEALRLNQASKEQALVEAGFNADGSWAPLGPPDDLEEPFARFESDSPVRVGVDLGVQGAEPVVVPEPTEPTPPAQTVHDPIERPEEPTVTGQDTSPAVTGTDRDPEDGARDGGNDTIPAEPVVEAPPVTEPTPPAETPAPTEPSEAELERLTRPDAP